MRECQQCGEANQANSRFCVVCGTPLAAAASSGASPLVPAAPPPAFAPVAPAAAPLEAVSPVIAIAPASAAAPPAYAPGSPGGTGRPSPNLASTAGRELGADFPLDGPRTLVGFLVSYETVELGQYWSIHQGRNVVGRQGAATGLDIEVSHPTTSSLHAILLATARPARVVVEDTSSTNGTFVNDNLLAAGQRWELRDGDRIRFGLFNATIKIVQKT
jgi:FHA domain-containing protein/zinc ribbon protein